jgi:hypothetical protein
LTADEGSWDSLFAVRADDPATYAPDVCKDLDESGDEIPLRSVRIRL